MNARQEDVAYLLEKSIPQLINEFVQELLNEKPAQPVSFMQDGLMKMKKMKLLKDPGTLTYFAGIKSRGEPTQMIAKYGGVQMKVNLISFEEWGKLKSDKIPFMPFITQSDGTIMLETENICKHLATMGGKFVVDSKQEELCKIANSPPMQLADPLYNLPDGGASLGVPPLEKWLEAVTPVLKDLVGKLGDGPFFAGEAPGYGEAFIFHNLDNQFALAKPELTTAIGKEAMAKLEAFYARFAALDGIKEYLAERPKVWGVPGSKGNPVGGSKDLGTLTYFAGIKSRGEPTQMIAKYGGVQMKVNLISFEEWGKLKSDKIPFMPFITQSDGTIMLETENICKHLATMGGKFVVDSKQEELCKIANSPPMQLADPLYNLPDGGASLGVPPLEKWLEAVTPVLKDLVGKLGDGPFFAGEAPGYGEAFIFHNLDNQFALAKPELTTAIGKEAMAKLEAFYARFAALDGIKEYLAERPKVWGVPGSKGNPVGGSKDLGTLTYFAGIKSRGEPTQMIAKYGGVQMKVNLISFEEWGKLKSDKIPFMPFITQSDGTIMLETENICKHLATMGGKFVVDSKQEELCKIANSPPMQLADPLYNLPDGGASLGVPPLEKWLEAVTPVLKDLVGKLGDGPFFAGEAPGYGEAFIFHNLDNQFALAKPELTTAIGKEAMAKLEAFYARFAALDGIKEYLAERPKVWGVPGSKGNPVGGSKDVGTLTYFAGIKSRGEPTQMIAKYGGVQMKVNLISFEEWGKLKSDKIPFMPFITQSDGTIMLETENICKHLATMGGKFVVDSKQEELCKIANSPPMQLADPLYNLPDGGASLGVPPLEKWLEAVTPVLKDLVGKLGDGPFFAGEAPGHGEAFIFHNLDNQFALAKPELTTAIGKEAMAKLEAFYARFAALDGIKEYLAERPKVWGVPGSKGNPVGGSKDVGTLTYFAGIKSRGEPTQMIAKYGGVQMKVNLISFEEWGKLKSDKIPFMPFITQSDGTIMLETENICKHLATMGGKFVVDSKQEELCKIANSPPMQLADPLYNLPDGGASLGVPPLEKWLEAVTPVLKDLVGKLGDGPFFAGEAPGYGEAFIFHNLDNQFALAKPELTTAIGKEAMAKLEAFYARFAALDGIKEYLAERPKVWGVPGSKGNPVGGSKDLGTLTYFAGIKSRGEPTQMIAKYGGVQMKVNLISFEEWGKLKSDKIPFMPFITQSDGTIMLETENICKHLATMGGKFVVDSKQEELCKIANSPPMQLADPLYNLPDGGASLGVPPLAKWLEAVTPVLKDLVGKLGDGPFFAGEAPGYGEAFIFHNLDNQFALAKHELTTAIGKEAMAKLEAFYARFAALDGIEEYLAERPKVWGVPGSKGNPVGGSKDVGTLTYFAGIKSRGEPTQMIAKYGGVQMKVNLISFEEWGKLKSDKIPFMPFITQSDGTIMLETENICKHLATMGGKFVVDSKQEELCKIANSPPMQLADPLYNLPDGGASLGVPPLEKWLEAVTPVLKDLVGKLGDGPFFAGEAPGYGEAFIFHNLDNQFALAKPELTTAIGKEAMAKLEAFYARFAALDGIKEYLAERPKVWGVPGSKGNPVGGSKDVGTLTYFAGIKSRGEPTQMIAKYGGVQMKVNLISFEEWGKLKSDKIPFMPFITQSDGTIMLETENICKHLATMGGKFVVDSKQEELCKIANSPPMQLADPLYNLPDGGASLGVPPLAKWLEAVTPVLKDLVGKLGDGPFFAGEAPGYGEAFIFHNLDNQFALAKHELTTAIGKEAMAKLEAFYARFAALDGIEEYLAERPKVWGVPGSKGNPVGGSKDVGTLTYFAGIKSRGEPTQMIAKYGGVQMKFNLISFEEWGKLKSDKIPFMPFITQSDGTIMLETENICKHLATMGGKFVVDSKQEELCKIANSPPMQLADPLYNLPDGGASLGVPPLAKWLEAVTPVLKDLVGKLGDGPFFAGEAPGYGEAFIFHNLDNQFALAKPELTTAIGKEAMAKLEAFYARFSALDGIKEYLAERPKVWGVPGSKGNPA